MFRLTFKVIHLQNWLCRTQLVAKICILFSFVIGCTSCNSSPDWCRLYCKYDSNATRADKTSKWIYQFNLSIKKIFLNRGTIWGIRISWLAKMLKSLPLIIIGWDPWLISSFVYLYSIRLYINKTNTSCYHISYI